MQKLTACIWLLLWAIPALCQCPGNGSEQPCCNDLIHTWPPAAVNTERPDLQNRFNWTQPALNTYHPSTGYMLGAGPMPLGNPFYTRSSALQHINFYRFPLQMNNPDSLDFHPQDGWELIHRHLGYLPDEQSLVTNPLDNRIGPYFILYNKYTGLLRLLASFNFEPQDEIVTTLGFYIPNPTSVLKPSGLLMNHNTLLRALDKPTTESSIIRAAPFPVGRGFFVADFSMAYDPCICNNESELEFKFATLNVAQAYMEGRLTGTIVPLNTSGVSPLLNGPDFLLAVKRDNFTINGGAAVYNNINRLVEQFKAPPSLSWVEKQSLDLFGKGLSAGAKAGDKWLDGVLTPLVKKYIFSPTFPAPPAFKLGLPLAAQAANMIMSSISPGKPAVPAVQVVEGELALSGTVSDNTDLNNGEIQIKTPGSKNSQQPTVPWKNYPAYNEALGLFALLETPKIEVQQLSYPQYYTNETGTFGNLMFNTTRFRLLPLKYVFNPAVDIDLDKTRIYVALETDIQRQPHGMKGDFSISNYPLAGKPTAIITDFFPLNCFYNMAPEFIDSTFLYSITNLTFIPSPIVDQENIILDKKGYFFSSVPITSETPFIDLPALATTPVRWSSAAQVRVKIMIEYVFKPNAYGKQNRSFQLLTYPAEFGEGQLPLPGTNGYIVGVEEFNNHDNTFAPFYHAHTRYAFYGTNMPLHYRSPDALAPYSLAQGSFTAFTPSTISAWNQIVINGRLEGAAGKLLTVHAGSEITMEPESQIVGETELKILFPSPAASVCDDINGPRPNPASENELKSFCQGSSYKGNIFMGKKEPIPYSNSGGKDQSRTDQVKLYPNPSSQDFTIGFELLQNGDIAFSIMDIHARLLHSEKFTGYSKGVYQLPVHSSLAAGIYLVQVTLNGHTELHKLIITK